MQDTTEPHLPATALLAAALLLVSTSAGQAIDCAKAKSPVDKAICADTGTKAQDAALSRLYFATLRTLDGRRHDTLIEDQRRWLKERAETCADPAGGISACLQTSAATRIKQISTCYGGAAPDPAAGGVICAAAAHASCPRFEVSASAAIWAYPFLVDKLRKAVDDRTKGPADADLCAPESEDRPGTPDQNEAEHTITLEGAGTGWVAARTTADDDFRGAPHPMHWEDVTTYEVPSGKPFPMTRLMPGLKSDPKTAQALWDAADAAMSYPCCGDDDKPDLQTDIESNGGADAAGHPLPTAWSIEADGALKVFYRYSALGRTFVASAVLKRSMAARWMAPQYLPLLTGRH